MGTVVCQLFVSVPTRNASYELVHQTTRNTSLPFVHTARRFYRWTFLRVWWTNFALNLNLLWKFTRTTGFKGKRSRNKAAVGEPAAGSLPRPHPLGVPDHLRTVSLPTHFGWSSWPQFLGCWLWGDTPSSTKWLCAIREWLHLSTTFGMSLNCLSWGCITTVTYPGCRDGWVKTMNTHSFVMSTF